MLRLPIFGLIPHHFIYDVYELTHDTVTAAGLISEIGDINRFASPDKLAAYAGISPMQYSSGQTDKNFSNKRGNRNLHQILFFMAVSLSNDPANRGKPVNQYFYDYYRKKISEGKTKKQSIKCVMRKLVNIIYKMMRDKSEYREPQQKNSQDNISKQMEE